MNEKQLLAYWKKYIDRPIYRVVSGFHFDEILKNGINPGKDPYENIKPKLFKLYSLVLELEKKGYIMHFISREKSSIGSYWAKVAVSDLKKPVVDFTPKESDLEYYLNLKGGAMPRNVDKLTSRIIQDKPALNADEWKLINELNTWAKKMEIQNRIIVVRGSAKFFENAMFQLTNLSKSKVRKAFYDKYLPCPFGSFEHFLKFVKKNDLRKYTYRLKNNRFYLRVRDKIPADEIEVIEK